MKLIIKRFQDGIKVTVEGCDTKAQDKAEKRLRQMFAGNCEQVTVTTFDEPLPSCGPGEKNC